MGPTPVMWQIQNHLILLLRWISVHLIMSANDQIMMAKLNASITTREEGAKHSSIETEPHRRGKSPELLNG